MPPARLLIAVTALLACGQDPDPPTLIKSADTPEPIAAPIATAPIAAPAVVVEDGPIGVEPCDHYVDSYRRCIAEVVPEEERPVHQEVVEGQRLAWARARHDEVLAAGLPEACAAAEVAARVAVPRCRQFRATTRR